MTTCVIWELQVMFVWCHLHNYYTLKLEWPCMLVVEISWWIMERLEEHVCTALSKLFCIELHEGVGQINGLASIAHLHHAKVLPMLIVNQTKDSAQLLLQRWSSFIVQLCGSNLQWGHSQWSEPCTSERILNGRVERGWCDKGGERVLHMDFSLCYQRSLKYQKLCPTQSQSSNTLTETMPKYCCRLNQGPRTTVSVPSVGNALIMHNYC